MNETEEYVVSILRSMMTKGRYGVLTIKIQDGKVAHVNEGKDHKPPKNIDISRM
jgi:hypothetical protein